MALLNISTGIQLDKKRITKKGYPIKIRVTYDRQPRYYRTGEYATEAQYRSLTKVNPRGELKDVRLRLSVLEEKATDIIKDLGDDFTFDKFKEAYHSKPRSNSDVFSLFNEYIDRLTEEERIGTASSYTCAMKSLAEFAGRSRLEFSSITVKWLSSYQASMTSEGKSPTTIGIYLRSLRTILNLAIEKGYMNQKDYPFGRRKFVIPAGRNIKKALTRSEIELIKEYDTSMASDWERIAKDFWLLSYYCNGANISDLCTLRFKDLSDKHISFIREKTKNTSVGNQKPIIVFRSEPINTIIARYQQPEQSPEQYVFCFLNGKETPERKKSKIRQVIKNINNWMDKIAKKQGITQKVTTISARHSFSTQLKHNGISVEMISESLGHSNVKVTEHYLDSFDDVAREQITSIL